MSIRLPKRLEEFVANQVRSGRFANRDEVIAAALRQMEEQERQREMEAFNAAFRDCDRYSPKGEPTRKDLADIDRIVKSVRGARRQREAA